MRPYILGLEWELPPHPPAIMLALYKVTTTVISRASLLVPCLSYQATRAHRANSGFIPTSFLTKAQNHPS